MDVGYWTLIFNPEKNGNTFFGPLAIAAGKNKSL